ncbi:hypothetical protein MED121_14414 [Marinomonas sp. MED121]|uniref:RICIN domain-containing protein n=1 Tax=Marinomonas sp. MED121 TaxID=314277 RepID=UPI0000691112|nr:RICIN domain-containing protein [Marinomonas sp. MED121]EAQ67128.1 hypothetical protein MED121_14414 [Marinomonas sp. MED121]
MKKTLLYLSMLASASSVYADTGDQCSAYIDRVESNGGVTYNIESAAILSANTAITTGVEVLGQSTLSAVFPYASIILRQITPGETTAAADPDLVACLESFDSRLTTLETYLLAEEASIALNAVRSKIQKDIIEQHDAVANFDVYESYDVIAAKLAGTLSYFLHEDQIENADADIYETIKNDTLLYLLSAQNSAFLHNLEFNAYCAKEKNYQWTSTATSYIEHNDSKNHALMDYDLLKSLSDFGYSTEDLQESNFDITDCELGRDSHSRYKALLSENTSYSPIAQIYDDLGFDITLDSGNSNYLDVAIDIDSSKLADYRKGLIGSCSHSVDWGIAGHSGRDPWGTLILGGAKITTTSKDYGGTATFSKSVIAGRNKIDSAKRYNEGYCDTWVGNLEDDLDDEVITLLNAIKVSLKNLSMYQLVRPAYELAGRAPQFLTYETGVIDNDLLESYMLVPQFDVNDEGDISDNYNHYQLFNAANGDRYLKHRFDVGIVARNNGSGIDSHWQLSQRWPGEKTRMMNVYTNECVVISDAGELHMRSCDEYPIAYVWDIHANTSGAVDASLKLSSNSHKNQCVLVSDETMPEYSNSNKIAATDCDITNANQTFVLGDNNDIRVNGICLDVPRSEAFAGQSVIVYSCHYGDNQSWDLNPDGTIQSALNAVDGTNLCLEANDATSDIAITLQACDSSNPAQKFIPNEIVEEEEV